jgi:hypothetical protein
MRTLSKEVNASGIRPTEGFSARHPTILRFSSALIFAAALALAPVPAFAQHGGGGGGAGGGGGSHGGGGGGGGHASGGSGGSGSHAGGTSAPSGGGSGSHPSASSAGGSNNNSGGHWWNPFHSGSSGNGNSGNAGNVKSGSNQSSEHYAAGNNTWQDPPATTGRASGHVNYGPANGVRPTGPQRNPTNGAINSARGAVATPPHVFPPRHPGRPYYPYYPYYPYSGFGWGGGLWWGGFYPCDPFWGCYGYGYGYGYGGGYGYYGGSFGGDYSADLSYNSPNDATVSQEPNPTLYAAPSSDAEQSSGAGSSEQQPYVILYLKDGSSYAVSDYWLFGGKLHYVTSYGGENMIDQSQLDLQRTVNENAARGVDFTLRPEPAGNGATVPPAPTPDANPPAPQP